MDITFNLSAFVENLRYMGLGMLGIFVVIGAIVTVTYVLNTLFKGRKKEDENDKD